MWHPIDVFRTWARSKGDFTQQGFWLATGFLTGCSDFFKCCFDIICHHKDFHCMIEGKLQLCKKILWNSMFLLKGFLLNSDSAWNVEDLLLVAFNLTPWHFIFASTSCSSHVMVPPTTCIRISKVPAGSKRLGTPALHQCKTSIVYTLIWNVSN